MTQISTCLGTKVFFADNFNDLSDHVNKYGTNTLWVCDTSTARMVRPLPTPNVVFDNGESSKSFSSIEKIVSTAIENNLDRDCTFIAFGGGVICDLTAFAASIYMRGCKVILIPTTVSAMADACLGGKTSIDFRFAKNVVGSFFPANEVLICIDSLKSLPNKEYLEGFAEILKHSLLTKDDSLFNILASQKQEIINRDPEVLKEIIRISLMIKKSYLDNDQFDRQGIRAALDLGHTFGHALESMSRLQWTHNQAVAWGVCKAAEVSREMNLCTAEFASGILKLFNFYEFDTRFKIQRGEWQDFKSQLLKDKKVVAGSVRFILIKNQGEYEISPVDFNLIKSVVMYSFS
ncbi:MAG: 3-dehydroquinate synthase [Sphaerochaetaceae bacterium]|nr:3-dehydroquinate synthase [Sphaerochaetaceae bacterium]